MSAAAHLEVWGDPIAHSRSPALHAAAYRVLGLPWTYGRRRVDEAGFAAEFDAARAAGLRGLSLTMPLKAAAHIAAEERDSAATLTGAVNTLLLDGRVRAFNTDVGGIVRALADAGVTHVARARIVGTGATATSALVALGHLGASHADVAARRPDAAGRLVALGRDLGVTVTATALAADHDDAELTIATLPGDASVDPAVAARLAERGGVLLDVVYGHRPTALSQAWAAAGRTALSGEGMLLHQAVLQVRVFTTGRVGEPLPDEAAVVAEMRAALMGD